MIIEEYEIFYRVKEDSIINYKFILKALNELEKNEIQVKIFESKITDDDCSGYFDDTNKVLAISTERPAKAFVGLFAHEFCHFIQWKRNVKVWKDALNVIDYYDPQYYGKDISKSIKLTQKLERDCERRVLKYIENGKLDLDSVAYIKSANCYIAFHDIINLTRKWYENTTAYEANLQKLVPGDTLIKTIDCLGPLKHKFILECIKNVY